MVYGMFFSMLKTTLDLLQGLFVCLFDMNEENNDERREAVANLERRTRRCR
jgi:hypothetical protein